MDFIHPTDSYNGLVVSAAAPDDAGVFRRAIYKPPIAVNNRSLINVLAPGKDIKVPTPTADGQGEYGKATGSSFAAPHATATAALLIEAARTASLGAEAEQHQVLKAILMNSAEKVDGRLGMKRTVLKRNGNTWDQSDARDEYADDNAVTLQRMMTPLDQEMGTGFLNAKRALEQMKGGKFSPGG